MMNRFIYLFLLLGCSAWALAGCTGDPDVEPQLPVDGDGNTWVTIDFGDNSFDQVHITTRATLDNVAESRVNNLFIFIFNSAGERLYGRYFDPANRVDSNGELEESKVECWLVEGNAAETEPEGKVRIYAPTVTDGGSLYVLANINADMVNVSPEKLRFVQSLDDLKAMTASLNQQITERNGFFPMTGWAKVASITSSSINFSDTNLDTYKDGQILLTRLDAKVDVKLRVAEGYEAYNITTGTNHIIKSFVPLSWQVVNLPRTSYVLPRGNREDARDKEGKKDLFNTREVKFETRELSKEPFTYKQEILIKDGNSYKYEYKKDEYGNEILDKEGNKILETRDVKVDHPETHGFSFYMLENRLPAKGEVPTKKPDPNVEADKPRLYEAWGYHARETRLKDDAGVYLPDQNGTGNIWKYAPAEGTYLVIKGEVVMALKIDDEGLDQQLSADAVYYIHLGDFATSVDNYDVERNTSYTYTITIYGVDNIDIEVRKVKDKDGKEQSQNQENESGATGHVYVAKERIFNFDSHFASAEVSFDEKHLTDVEHLTWYVRTPFGREGKPHIVNGVEVPAGLDYQWVKFMRNSFTTDENGNEVYSTKRQKYDPQAVKNVLDFSKYIKEQKEKFTAWKNGETPVNESDFRREFDEQWYQKFGAPAGKSREDDGEWYRYRIHLTIFVDEFYYDANPLTGDVRQDLWKEFVNQPDRLMHILCDANKSNDEASLSTGSVVTIRQHSIQTIFNTQKPELMTAWGCETVDETAWGKEAINDDVSKRLWYYTSAESYSSAGYWQKPTVDNVPLGVYLPPIPTNDGNTSDGNGLYNTVRLWGLLGEDGAYSPKLWSTYVDQDKQYGLCDGQDNKGNVIRTLRYSCMTRNRDEDGDNIIDAEEIKWYMAAISQLGSLYVGDQGLSADAVLYSYERRKETGYGMVNCVYPWRSHIVSSTRHPEYGGYPEIMWAEEGLSTGPYNESYGKSAALSVRCVRNLGMEPTSDDDARKKLESKDDDENLPAIAIDVQGPGLGNNTNAVDKNSVYTFNLTNLNPLSIRYYTSQELEPNNEFSVEARPYWVFETGTLTVKTYTYEELYELLRDGRSPCPDGYRTPNIREGALMSLRIEYRQWQSLQDYGRVSTYYSHGTKMLGGKEIATGQDSGSYSWLFDTERVRLDDGGSYKVRCVRDIRQ